MTVLGASLVGQMLKETPKASLGAEAMSDGEKLPPKISAVLGTAAEVELADKLYIAAGAMTVEIATTSKTTTSASFFCKYISSKNDSKMQS
jgi:hypothetical protein